MTTPNAATLTDAEVDVMIAAASRHRPAPYPTLAGDEFDRAQQQLQYSDAERKSRQRCMIRAAYAAGYAASYAAGAASVRAVPSEHLRQLLLGAIQSMATHGNELMQHASNLDAALSAAPGEASE